VILLDGTEAFKTVRFRRRIHLGDPVNIVSLFSAFSVDELVLLDIGATVRARHVDFDLVRAIASEAHAPFSIGGGVRTLDHIRTLLSLGAEKVILSSVVYEDPAFVTEAVRKFGSSSVAVCIDVDVDWLRRQVVFSHSGRKKHLIDPVRAARGVADLGVGEIIIQAISRDGMRNGYDLALLARISSAVRVPVVALGGAGCLQHMLDAYAQTEVSALAAGSFFVFKGSKQGVLPNYPTQVDLEQFQKLRKSPC
jgi:imidazole glycerol-phosphate synthase subunit HisF